MTIEFTEDLSKEANVKISNCFKKVAFANLNEKYIYEMINNKVSIRTLP
jgi:hypothetical protein